jgi:hypothetical protein
MRKELKKLGTQSRRTSTSKDASQQFLTKAKLKERGWTDSLIKQFLPLPDKTKMNLHHKSGPPVCLYRQERVTMVESSEEFVTAAAATAARRRSAQNAVETKRAKTVAYVSSVKIEVPKMENDLLVKRACEHFNLKQDRERGAYSDSDPLFLSRISVNYLRHQMTAYEDHLRETAAQVGAREAYLDIKVKVLNAIGAAYPFLNAECKRQSAKAEREYVMKKL